MIRTRVHETAYAKINLALHVRKRREDGYHELETLFAFVDAGDELSVSPAASDNLETFGEFAIDIGDPFGNIVSRALNKLPRAQGWAVTLEKRLPVAAGLGGGSADAGAVFRMVRESCGLPEDWRNRAAALGADVPACVESVTCVGRGTGTELTPIANDLSGVAVLLVNPRIAMPTGPVFRAWDGVDRGSLSEGPPSSIAEQGRNDLEAPAISLCPQIADVLAALNRSNAFLARMSGSGATCFGLFRSQEAMLEAKAEIAASYPQWWTMSGRLR